jgi:hypothetical protein
VVLSDDKPALVSYRLIGVSRQLIRESGERLQASQQALSAARERVHWVRNAQQKVLIRDWLSRNRP